MQHNMVIFSSNNGKYAYRHSSAFCLNLHDVYFASNLYYAAETLFKSSIKSHFPLIAQNIHKGI